MAKSFCDKYVPMLLNVLYNFEGYCINADHVTAVSQFLYCIQSSYMIGVDGKAQNLKNRMFSLIDGINDSNPLKEAFFADTYVDANAARYLFSTVLEELYLLCIYCSCIAHSHNRTFAQTCTNLFLVAGKLRSSKPSLRRLISESSINATHRMFWNADVGLSVAWCSLLPLLYLRQFPQFCSVQHSLPRRETFLSFCSESGGYRFLGWFCLLLEALNFKDL